MVETEKGEMGMKKWMIPVFVAGGAAVVGTAVLGGILILENKPGMKSPEEVAVKVVQAQIIDGDFEELCMLGRYPMIKAVCDLEATDRQTLQCVDQAKEYWNESVQNTMEVLGEMQDYSVVDIELIPVDEEEIEQTKGRYNSVGDIARMFLSDSMKKINSFDYIEKYNEVTKEYAENVLKNVFKKENLVLSVINCKEK